MYQGRCVLEAFICWIL